MADYRRGTLLPGAAEGTGTVQGVRVADGGWIDFRAHDDTTWASVIGYMELDNLEQGGRAADIPHGLPGQGKPVDLPG